MIIEVKVKRPRLVMLPPDFYRASKIFPFGIIDEDSVGSVAKNIDCSSADVKDLINGKDERLPLSRKSPSGAAFKQNSSDILG
jgi:hypothetical protein